MKAVVDAKIFSETLNKVSKLIKTSSFPVMEGILVQFENGRCVLSSTNLTTWLTMELPAQGDSFAFVLGKPRAVIKACRYFEGDLSLELRQESKSAVVELACGQRSGTFNAYSAEGHHAQPEQKKGVSFTTNAAALLKRIERVKYAVRAPCGNSDDAQRTCVQFHENQVFCVDGRRAACDTDPSLTFPVPFLTWGDSLSYLKLMGDSEVQVRIEDYYIRLTSDTVSLCCHREGVDTFDLMRAVPKSFLEEFYVSPKEFLRELEYLEGFQTKHRSAVRFCGGRMVLKNRADRCSTEVRIEGVSEIAIGFDQRYMRDALKQFSDEERVKVKFSGCHTPIIIEADGRSDFALILPVRLNSARAA